MNFFKSAWFGSSLLASPDVLEVRVKLLQQVQNSFKAGLNEFHEERLDKTGLFDVLGVLLTSKYIVLLEIEQRENDSHV